MPGTKRRRRREYLRLLDKAKEAAECSIDNFNRAKGSFKTEASLILIAVAWELLAKSLLVHQHKPIRKRGSEDTISAEIAIHKLLSSKSIQQHQSDVVQQIVSLRNASVHDVLPTIPIEVQHHLMYYALKYFRETIEEHFKGQAKDLEQHYLCLSFGELTTYADKVKKSISKMKRNASDSQLVWLLERGIAFDGTSYLTQKKFKTKLKGKTHTLPYLEMGRVINNSDMVKIVPVEAPRNYTADISLRKGSKANTSLPVVMKKSEIESDYPYLTRELADLIGKNTNFVAKAASVLKLKGNDRYHQSVRASRSGTIQRYSEAAKNVLIDKIKGDPDFNPYTAC